MAVGNANNILFFNFDDIKYPCLWRSRSRIHNTQYTYISNWDKFMVNMDLVGRSMHTYKPIIKMAKNVSEFCWFLASHVLHPSPNLPAKYFKFKMKNRNLDGRSVWKITLWKVHECFVAVSPSRLELYGFLFNMKCHFIEGDNDFATCSPHNPMIVAILWPQPKDEPSFAFVY